MSSILDQVVQVGVESTYGTAVARIATQKPMVAKDPDVAELRRGFFL